MSMAMRAPALLTLLWLNAFAVAAAAETVYVSDRFEIGIHESTSIDSVILAVIPSGTPLEVAGRDGEFVQVTTPDGIKGWVDGRYLVSERPAGGAVTQDDAKLAEATRLLGAARAEVEVLRQRVSELQRDAASASRGSAPPSDPAPAASKEASAKLADARRKVDELTRQNRQLKDDIEALKTAQDAAAQSAAEPAQSGDGDITSKMWRGPVSEQAKSWTLWQWLLFASILLLAFAAGGYAVDWDSRRRHGGFRI